MNEKKHVMIKMIERSWKMLMMSNFIIEIFIYCLIKFSNSPITVPRSVCRFSLQVQSEYVEIAEIWYGTAACSYSVLLLIFLIASCIRLLWDLLLRDLKKIDFDPFMKMCLIYNRMPGEYKKKVNIKDYIFFLNLLLRKRLNTHQRKLNISN